MIQTGPVSRVDLNRTGVPLMEIVSEPDMRTPEEAGAYLRQLRSIVRYLDVSDGNLEEGSFRCDANVSIMPEGADTFGTRTELKNLNSFKHVEKAIAFEVERQKEIVLDGGEVIQETRLWDPDQNRTFSMRGKEDAHDYRYFPDPDLLPLVMDDAWIETIENSLPELPEQKKTRFMEAYALPDYDAGVLTTSRELADYFEACVKQFPKAKTVSNWIMGPLQGLLNTTGKTILEAPVSYTALAELLKLEDEGVVSNKIAKTVFDEMALSGDPAKTIVEKKGLVQVSDVAAIEKIVDAILFRNPNEVAAFKNGKTKLMGFFVGQVMRESRGKADPKIVNRLLKAKL